MVRQKLFNKKFTLKKFNTKTFHYTNDIMKQQPESHERGLEGGMCNFTLRKLK